MKKIILVIIMVIMSLGAANAAEDFDFGALDVTLLNQDPDPAEPGEYVELRFKVQKAGNDELNDISFELQPQYPFRFDESDTPIKDLGSWKIQSDNNEYYSLYYKLRVDEEALEDVYNLTLVQRANGIKQSSDFEVRVDEPKNIELDIGSVKTSPQELVPDFDDASIDIEIVNNGEEDASQVISQMQLPDGVDESFGYSNRDTLGTIEAGSKKTAKYYIDTLENLSSGVHQTQLDIQYKNNEDNTVEEIEVPFELRVFGKPQYELLSTNVTKGLSEGSRGEIFVELTNIGEKDADLVSVQLFKDSSQPFSFDDKSDFIGKIEQGDSGQAMFNFDVDEGAVGKEYKITMQIRSIVDEEVFVEEKDLTIPVENGNKDSDYTMYYIAIGIIISLGLGYFAGRYKLK